MKKKKMFVLMLLLMVLGAASMNAQVTIGGDKEPHGGAVLDLSQAKGDQVGLLLPNVQLANTGAWQLGGDKFTATGMMVYNTKEDIAGDGANGAGIYVWNGLAWKPIDAGLGGLVKVTHYDLTPASSSVDVWVNGTVNFTASNFKPETATYQSVSWEITSGDEFAEITSFDATGCTIKGLSAGDAVLTVKTTDEFAAPKTVTIHVKPVTLASFDLSAANLTLYTLGSNTSATLTASNFKGSDGNAISGITVTWSVVDGTVTGSVSPESGNNTTTVSAGTAAGAFTVRVSYGGITQEVPVTVVGLKSITLDKSTLAINGANQTGTVAVSQFTGTNDAAMPGMSGVTVNWTTANPSGVTGHGVSLTTTGTGTATVSGGSTAGTFNVIATVAGTTIQSSPCAVTVITGNVCYQTKIGDNNYRVCSYTDGTTWMLENSREGTPNFEVDGVNFYAMTSMSVACPTGWAVPSTDQINALKVFLDQLADSAFKAEWNASPAVGYVNATGGYTTSTSWVAWLSESAGSDPRMWHIRTISWMNTDGVRPGAGSMFFPVRCMR
jgi:hypothetical protein